MTSLNLGQMQTIALVSLLTLYSSTAFNIIPQMFLFPLIQILNRPLNYSVHNPTGSSGP